MPDQIPDSLPLKKVMIVVDLRGEKFAEMTAGEYATRVAGVDEILAQDLVLVSSPDTKSGTIVRGPAELGGAIYTMEIVEAAGHSKPVVGTDKDGETYINLGELLGAMSGVEFESDWESDRTLPAPASMAGAAAWIAKRYDVELPEVD